MGCDVAKFTITKGVDNTFVFTIKADGSTLPMVMTAGDTFTAAFIIKFYQSFEESPAIKFANQKSSEVVARRGVVTPL